MSSGRLWLRILSPALVFLAARLLLTACMERAGAGEQAGALSSCLLVLPVVLCFVRLDRGPYRFAPIRLFLPWAAAAAALLLVNVTLVGRGEPGLPVDPADLLRSVRRGPHRTGGRGLGRGVRRSVLSAALPFPHAAGPHRRPYAAEPVSAVTVRTPERRIVYVCFFSLVPPADRAFGAVF